MGLWVNFDWFEDGDDDHFALSDWPEGVSLPRVGERIEIPHDEFLHEVLDVVWRIRLSQESLAPVHSTPWAVDIRTLRTRRRIDDWGDR